MGTIRGRPNEPVTVKTDLGWVFSGPMKSLPSSIQLSAHVNFVRGSMDDKVSAELDSEVHKLWDLETIRI